MERDRANRVVRCGEHGAALRSHGDGHGMTTYMPGCPTDCPDRNSRELHVTNDVEPTTTRDGWLSQSGPVVFVRPNMALAGRGYDKIYVWCDVSDEYLGQLRCRLNRDGEIHRGEGGLPT